MSWLPVLVKACYFAAALLFILGIKRMASPLTARSGIQWAGAGMLLVTAATFACDVTQRDQVDHIQIPRHEHRCGATEAGAGGGEGEGDVLPVLAGALADDAEVAEGDGALAVLAGWVATDHPIDAEAARRALATLLPAWALPGRLVGLPALPLALLLRRRLKYHGHERPRRRPRRRPRSSR